MSCWAGEDGEEKEVGFMLTQAAVNNSNVVPIPMLWRTGAAGGGFPDNTCGLLIRQVICGREFRSSEKRGRRANRGVCLCVRRRVEGNLEEYYHRTTHKEMPVDFLLSHTCASVKKTFPFLSPSPESCHVQGLSKKKDFLYFFRFTYFK